MKLFIEENRQSEREFLGGYNLDVRLFEAMGLKISQIIPARNVYRILTDKGFFSLKKLRFPEEDMDFVLSAGKYLEENGFANICKLVEQKNGDSFVDFMGDKYYLTEWIDGRECDLLNPQDLNAASETLAFFHEAARGYNPVGCPVDRCFYGKWPESFRREINEMGLVKERILSKTEKSEMDEIYLNYLNISIKDGEEALRLLGETDYEGISGRAEKEGGLIHHGYAQCNILHAFDGRTHIVDLDYCIMDIRIHDIGSLILRSMKKSDWDTGVALGILESYSRRSPLSREELKVLIPFLLFPHDFRAVSIIPDGEGNWDEEDLADKMDIKSEYSQMRKKFTEEYKKAVL